MSLRGRLSGLLGAATAVPALARAESVAALVPAGADYVTMGQFAVLADARGFIGGDPGSGGYRRDIGLVPSGDALPREAGLLVLAGGRVSLVAADGERWSAAATDLTDLDAHRHSGFVLVTRGGSGLVVTPQAPVEVPAGATWRTIGRVTNAVGGWDKQLAPYGVTVHW